MNDKILAQTPKIKFVYVYISCDFYVRPFGLNSGAARSLEITSPNENTQPNDQKPSPKRNKYQPGLVVCLFSCSNFNSDISRTTAQILTKLLEVKPKRQPLS